MSCAVTGVVNGMEGGARSDPFPLSATLLLPAPPSLNWTKPMPPGVTVGSRLSRHPVGVGVQAEPAAIGFSPTSVAPPKMQKVYDVRKVGIPKLKTSAPFVHFHLSLSCASTVSL